MNLLCFISGEGENWEAICLDLDIAVQGRSHDEVYKLLVEAINTYVKDAKAEDPATAHRLLTRSAPWHVRAKYMVEFMLWALRRQGREARHSFTMPCAA